MRQSDARLSVLVGPGAITFRKIPLVIQFGSLMSETEIPTKIPTDFVALGCLIAGMLKAAPEDMLQMADIAPVCR
jgi:hypothetical protein